MEENIKIIREKCISANPEIMELKFGCEVMYGDDLQEPRKVTIGNPYTVEKNKIFNPWNRDDISDLFEILGRPIRLADILLTMTKTLKVTTLAREGWLQIISGETWQLDDDNLSHQSPETLEFIAGLLK